MERAKARKDKDKDKDKGKDKDKSKDTACYENSKPHLQGRLAIDS